MNSKTVETSHGHAKQYLTENRERAKESIRSTTDTIDFHAEDLLMPPTLITAAGLKLVYDGSKNLSRIDNVHKIRNGRILDIVDGLIARNFDMESDAGALADVTADKLEQLIIAVEAWRQDALPKPVISYLALKNLTHTVLTVITSLNHPGENFRTPKANKYAMFLENLGAGLLLEAHANEHEQPESSTPATLRKVGRVSLAASLLFELSALRTMIQRARKDSSLS